MKTIFLVPLLISAYVQAGRSQDADETSRAFKVEDLQINMLAQGNAFSEDYQSISSDLSAMGVVARNALENTLRNLLESFRVIVVNGNENVPVLDPLVLGPLGPIAFEVAPGMGAELVASDFLMTGLRWYVVDDVIFSPLRLTVGVHLTVPWLTFTGHYDAQAKVGPLVLHRAGGNYRIFVNRLEVGVNVRLGTNILAGHLVLRELDIKIDIQDVNIRIEGMVGSSLINNFINHFVQSITQDVVQNEMENLSSLLSDQLFDVVNEVLKDYTLADIMN